MKKKKNDDGNKAGKVPVAADTLRPHRKVSKTREVLPHGRALVLSPVASEKQQGQPRPFTCPWLPAVASDLQGCERLRT